MIAIITRNVWQRGVSRLKTPRRGSTLSAQGIALGIGSTEGLRPREAKAALALLGRGERGCFCH